VAANGSANLIPPSEAPYSCMSLDGL
jgi:hypothetical protein